MVVQTPVSDVSRNEQATWPQRSAAFAGGLALIALGAFHALPGMLATAQPKEPAYLWTAALVWTIASSGYAAAGLGLWGAPILMGHWRRMAATAALASLLLLLLAREPSLASIGILDLLCLGILRGPISVPVPRRRFGWRVGWAILFGLWLYGATATMLRPWYQSWGATREEIARPMIGDERAGSRRFLINHVISVKAPPERIWPWLVQIGEDRAGFYSYDGLERLLGTRIHNVYEIRPEWQFRRSGDFVRSCPPDWMGGRWKDLTGWKVGAIEPNRLLFLENWGPMWIAHDSGETSRLGIRSDIGEVPFEWAPVELYLFEPIHFLMEQKMLRTIRDLAERHE